MPSETQARPTSHARSPSYRLLARISQYELLNRMWTDKATSGAVVRAHDFAYPDNQPMIANDLLAASTSELSPGDFAELLSGPTIDIVVGQDRRRWSIHRKLLGRYAPRLAACNMTSDTKKPGPQQSIELLQDDPAGFELFVKWLYQGRLDSVEDLSPEQKYDHAVSCHKLYLLCHRFELPELKNLSMDHYRLSLYEAGLVPDPAEINEIYRASPTHSAFRKLMAQIAARQIMDPDDDRDAEDYRPCFQDNPDFAVDMINAIRKGSGGILFDDPTEIGDDCEYHDHSNGAGCSHRPRTRGEYSSPDIVVHTSPPREAVSEKRNQTSLPRSPERMPRLQEADLVHLLKALPTTSTEMADHSHWTTATTEGEPDRFPQTPPPTPAKASNGSVKAQQERLKLASAVGSMDTILEADRRTEESRSKAATGVVPRGDGPLNYVAALRLKQQAGEPHDGHRRRSSRDLFDV